MRVVTRMDLGPEDDAVGVSGQDLKSHYVAAVRCDANKVTKSLFGFTGKRGLVNRVEDRLVPVKTKEGADINCYSKEYSKGNGPVEGFARGAVQYQTDVL